MALKLSLRKLAWESPCRVVLFVTPGKRERLAVILAILMRNVRRSILEGAAVVDVNSEVKCGAVAKPPLRKGSAGRYFDVQWIEI
jgi:hypothetical protein